MELRSFKRLTRGDTWRRFGSGKAFPYKFQGEDRIAMRVFVMGEPGSGSAVIANGIRSIYGFDREQQEEIDESRIDFVAYKSHFIKIALESMAEIVKRVDASGFKSQNTETMKDIENLRNSGLSWTEKEGMKEIWGSLRRIWDDIMFQQRVKSMIVNDAELGEIQHYFTSIERMRLSKYIPSMDDVVLCQKKLNGISETPLQKNLWLIEVAPIRSAVQFKRITQYFISGTIVAYCVDISNYDQADENGNNLLLGSLKLFKSLMSNPYMTGVAIYLIFTNEQDFERKLRQNNIGICFPEYNGGNNVKESFAHIRQEFEKSAEKSRPLAILVPNTFPREEDKKSVKRAILRLAIEMQIDYSSDLF